MKVHFQRIVSLILAISLSMSFVIISVSAAGTYAAGTYPVIFSMRQGYCNTNGSNPTSNGWYYQYFSGETAPETYNDYKRFPTDSYDLTATTESRYVYMRPFEIWYDSIGYTDSEVSGNTLTFYFAFDYFIDSNGSSDFYLEQDIDDFFASSWEFSYITIDSAGVRTSTVMPAECDIVSSTANDTRTSRVYLSAVITIPDGSSLEDPYFYCSVELAPDELLPIFYRRYGNQAAIYLNVYDCSVVLTTEDEILDKIKDIAGKLEISNSLLTTINGNTVYYLSRIYNEICSLTDSQELADQYLYTMVQLMSELVDDIDSIETATYLINDIITDYLPYLEDILVNTDDISATLDSELSNLNNKMDTFLALYNQFSTDFDSLLEDVSLSYDELAAIHAYELYSYQVLLRVAMYSSNICDELDDFYNDFLEYVDLLITTVSSESGDIEAQLHQIYELLEEFIENYSSGNVTYELPDGYIIPGEDGSEGEKIGFWDLAKAVIEGIWNIITGAVSTFIGGLSGLISGISNISGFFDFYRDGEIYDAIDYGGGDIWD